MRLQSEFAYLNKSYGKFEWPQMTRVTRILTDFLLRLISVLISVIRVIRGLIIY